jgi:hypothetical protein
MLKLLSSSLALAGGLIAAAPVAAHDATETHRTAPAAFGPATAEAWVTLDHGTPVEIGVGLSEVGIAALVGHPDRTSAAGRAGQAGHPDRISAAGLAGHAGHHPYAELSLPLPPEAAVTGFDHVLLNWNPFGHAPEGVFDVDHLDVHFYLTVEAAREAIDTSDPAFWEKAAREPEPDLMPADFVPPPEPEPIPAMGVHWSDETDPVFDGVPFTQVLIYGAWDGAVTFVEPMITSEILASKETIVAKVKQPARVAEPGYYPRRYRIGFDAGRRTHVVVLEDLVWRAPE